VGACVAVFMRRGSAVVSGSNIVALDSARIEAEAAAWIARLDGEGATEGDRATFQAWCKLSDLHLKAVERLSMLWSDMDGLASLSSGKSHVAPSSTKAQEQVPVRT
jgi:ferric-dicitrate binding protein FerR (iron transport regulator)